MSGFADTLRERTRKSHRMVENVGLIRGFLRGVVDVETYTRLLEAFEAIYQALESSLARHADHPVVGPFHRPELARSAALTRDLAFFRRSAPFASRGPFLATQRYVERIEAVAARTPERLVAHAYVRHLGDLSGGQILGAIVARALALTPPEGLHFYRFDQISDPAAFKREYRRRLDRLPLPAAGREGIVEEAIDAFRANLELFEALEGSALPVVARLVRSCAPGGTARPREREDRA